MRCFGRKIWSLKRGRTLGSKFVFVLTNQWRNKEYLFPIPCWLSVQDLIDRMGEFILDVLSDDLNLNNGLEYGLAFENLARYWCWKYENPNGIVNCR